jgi:hypothetical protein
VADKIATWQPHVPCSLTMRCAWSPCARSIYKSDPPSPHSSKLGSSLYSDFRLFWADTWQRGPLFGFKLVFLVRVKRSYLGNLSLPLQASHLSLHSYTLFLFHFMEVISDNSTMGSDALNIVHNDPCLNIVHLLLCFKYICCFHYVLNSFIAFNIALNSFIASIML